MPCPAIDAWTASSAKNGAGTFRLFPDPRLTCAIALWGRGDVIASGCISPAEEMSGVLYRFPPEATTKGNSMRGWGSVIQFTDQLFGHLRRADQRKWAHAYIEGLLSTPGKKSIRRLAATASESPTASQALHQFVNESPWEWTPACSQLRRWAEERARPEAWTIVPVVLPKRGNKS
jgi:hypothetical protein